MALGITQSRRFHPVQPGNAWRLAFGLQTFGVAKPALLVLQKLGKSRRFALLLRQTPKRQAAVRKQAPIVVANLLAAMKGKPLPRAYDGYGSCPLTVAYGKIVLAEFAYGGEVTPSFPLDPRVPRRSMWLLKTKLLPWLYWSHMFKGGEFDIPHRARGW